jgi:hypothetical protein
MNKQKIDWEKVKEQYKDWCFYNKQHLGRMFDSEAFWNFYLKQTLQQQREEIISEIIDLVKENRKGTFTDDGGNDCWYIDDLVKELKILENK